MISYKQYLAMLLEEFSDKQVAKLVDRFGEESEKYIKRFDELRTKNRKEVKGVDIYSFKSLDDLKGFLDGIDISKRQSTKEIKMEGADLVYENDKVKVYHIKSEKASCYYGSGTKWCTAGKEGNMFNSYNEDYNIYYIIDKNNPDTKAALVVGVTPKDYSLWNTQDEEITHLKPMVMSRYGIPKETFKPKEYTHIPDEGVYIGDVNGKKVYLSGWKGDSYKKENEKVKFNETQQWVDENCNSESLGEHNNWVVPNNEEWKLIADYQNKLKGKDKLASYSYWSSDEMNEDWGWSVSTLGHRGQIQEPEETKKDTKEYFIRAIRRS